MNEDVFPIENGNIPASYVSLPEGNLNNTTRWAPTSYKWSHNSTYRGYNPSGPFIISPFITSRGPTL